MIEFPARFADNIKHLHAGSKKRMPEVLHADFRGKNTTHYQCWIRGYRRHGLESSRVDS